MSQIAGASTIMAIYIMDIIDAIVTVVDPRIKVGRSIVDRLIKQWQYDGQAGELDSSMW